MSLTEEIISSLVLGSSSVASPSLLPITLDVQDVWTSSHPIESRSMATVSQSLPKTTTSFTAPEHASASIHSTPRPAQTMNVPPKQAALIVPCSL